MARSHGRVLASIWSDPDFRALSANAQQLYVLLLSQPNLTHAGTISITVRRWAGMTADATTETVLAALRVLSDRRFVVVEWDTEELLIRTLIRNDSVFKQPKVLRAAKADAEAVASPKIRRALRKEVMQCPIEEVSANARDEVSTLLAALAEALDTPPDDPNGGVSDSPSDSPRQAEVVPKAKAPRSAGGGSPAFSPTPAPSPAVSDGARGTLALVEPDASPTAATLLAGFIENCKKRPPSQTISRFGRRSRPRRHRGWAVGRGAGRMRAYPVTDGRASSDEPPPSWRLEHGRPLPADPAAAIHRRPARGVRMSPADAGKLLALCAAFDNRKPDPSGMAAAAWADALGGLSFEDCAAAIRRHYRDTDRYIMPAHVRYLATQLAEARAQMRARDDRQAIEAPPEQRVKPEQIRAFIDELAQRRALPEDSA
jgi:hypothetical protein